MNYFADTSYWIGLLNADDEFHEKAVSLGRSMDGMFITTQWVLTELLDGMSASIGVRTFMADFVRSLEFHQHVVVYPASDDWFHKGVKCFGERGDKEWSLTDCISFVLMEELGIREALTADHHFEQAGFKALLLQG